MSSYGVFNKQYFMPLTIFNEFVIFMSFLLLLLLHIVVFHPVALKMYQTTPNIWDGCMDMYPFSSHLHSPLPCNGRLALLGCSLHPSETTKKIAFNELFVIILRHCMDGMDRVHQTHKLCIQVPGFASLWVLGFFFLLQVS